MCRGELSFRSSYSSEDADTFRYSLRHVAEFINTLSNIPFLLMAVYGILSSIENDIPTYLWLPFVGIAMIGSGSFLFHMTVSSTSHESKDTILS